MRGRPDSRGLGTAGAGDCRSAAVEIEKAQQARLDGVGFYRFAIRERNEGPMIGLVLIERDRLEADFIIYRLEFWVCPPLSRQGIATSAVRLACGYAFNELNADEIKAYVRPDNAGSGKVLRQFGFLDTGVRRPSGLGRPLAVWRLYRRVWDILRADV